MNKRIIIIWKRVKPKKT